MCVHCGIQLKRIPRHGGGTWLVACSQSARYCPRNRGGHEESEPLKGLCNARHCYYHHGGSDPCSQFENCDTCLRGD
jgi:hypothetical protein